MVPRALRARAHVTPARIVAPAGPAPRGPGGRSGCGPILATRAFINVVKADIDEIRRRAMENMEQGAVTASSQADQVRVVEVLNEVLATETVCTLRDRNHDVMAAGIHASGVEKEVLEHAPEEQQHADRVAKRITALGGRPNLDPAGLATDRSAALTRSLLGFARRGKHRAQVVSLSAIVASMAALIRRTAVGLVLAFERDALEGRGRISIRTRDVELFGPPARVLGVAREGTHVVLEVSDDGPGIPEALRARVFEPYFTTKTQGPDRGTGLGLATVFGIIELHRASIEIDDGLDLGVRS